MSSIFQDFEAALEIANQDAIEAFYLQHNFQSEHGSILIKLLNLDYHQCHEDLVLTIQQLKLPEAVDVLYSTALKKYHYLEYDELFALARKCTWALADIGTLAAQEKLRQLAGGDRQIIAGYAQKRLNNWERELHRKGSNSDS